MNLYTVIMEFEGTTSVSQTTASTVVEALALWADGLRQPENYGLSSASAHRLFDCIREEKDVKPVGIRETVNVWCTTVLAGDSLALLNIVKTSRR